LERKPIFIRSHSQSKNKMVGVGFLRRKKSNVTGETALDRKGKVDGSSLLDGNGDPSLGTLYEPEQNNKKNTKKGSKAASNDENLHADPNQIYPPLHMHGERVGGYPQPGGPYPPAQHGQFPQRQQSQQQQQWGNSQLTQCPHPAPHQYPPNPAFSHAGQGYAPQPEGEKKKGRSWFGRKK
jgi:hypothetical protein